MAYLPMKRVISQKGADFLWPEGVGAGGHSSEQRVLQGILQAKLLQVHSCLGNLTTKEESGLSWKNTYTAIK